MKISSSNCPAESGMLQGETLKSYGVEDLLREYDWNAVSVEEEVCNQDGDVLQEDLIYPWEVNEMQYPWEIEKSCYEYELGGEEVQL